MDPTLYRKLVPEDFLRMNLPEKFWYARLNQIHASVLEEVTRYVEQVDRMIVRGIGLLICGNVGVGKTGAAAVVAKAARSRGHPTYFTRILDLRDSMRARETFDDNPIFERCREVDFLVLDHLELEDATAPYIDNRVLTELISQRGERHRSTVLTTRAKVPQMKNTFKGMLETTGPYLVPISMIGEDRRVQQAEDAKQQVLGGPRG